MRLVDLLERGGILAPLEVPSLESALALTLGRVEGIESEKIGRMASDLASGASGEMVRVHEHVLVALAQADAVEDVTAVIGVSPTPFTVDIESGDEGEVAKALFLLVTQYRVATLKDQMLPALTRYLREEERSGPLLAAKSAEEVAALGGLMAVELREHLLVEDAFAPIQYRVYPDTPFTEVVDLMIRRELHSVPVVGEDYEFLGVITTGDAMSLVIEQARSREVGGPVDSPETEPTAREIMTRTVMCVSEDQSLMEAASMMVNRDVEELPVVREGEMVGSLTRGEVLRLLFASVD